MFQKNLIVIVGPTGIGKTSAAINLAMQLKTEIISSDSRQFYSEMNIGTAVPSPEELAAVKHHFIQHKSIHDTYTVGDFERDAIEFINNYFQKNSCLIMVGGSGLYEKAVTEGLDDFPEVPANLREELNQELQDFGLEKLQNELQESDPMYYESVDYQNPQRVIRALEIIRSTGQPFSKFQNKKEVKRDFNVIKIGLSLEREEIYQRINQRVDLMMEKGLMEEVQSLIPYQNLNALQTVGYKELFSYLKGEINLEFAIEEIQKNTRRFAKRQLTWYRKDDKVKWFKPDQQQEILEFIVAQL